MHKNVLFFKDLQLSVSEWCPFGQNAISTFNDSVDSLKGVKSSLLTGTVDEEPNTSEFSITPRFTRVALKDFDMYNWIKFKGEIEYPEEVEQVEEIGVHVDKSGFLNYALKLEEISGRKSKFSLDDTTAVVADLVEDTSIMMEALLTQFQRRILSVVFGDTPFRPKFVIATTSELMPNQGKAAGYNDGEDMENEINQLCGIAYKFEDINPRDGYILGTNGMIFITGTPEKYDSVLSFYSFIRGLQLFQTTFFARLRQMWDQIKDLRTAILNLEREEDIAILQEELTQLGADIVLIEEVSGFMTAAQKDMQSIWAEQSPKLDADNKTLAKNLDIAREVIVTGDKIVDMEMVSSGLVDEIQGLRDMVNNLAEKRMREMSKLMTDSVQQGSDAQMSMAANIKASRYTGAAVKILSIISSGYLAMRISDLVLKGLDGAAEDFNWDLHWPMSGGLNVEFYGGWFQVLVGLPLWFGFAYVFNGIIKKSSDKMKEEKLAKDFMLHLRIPIDVRSTPEKVQAYLDKKQVTFHNVEITGHRVSWYQKVPKMVDDEEKEIFYTNTLCFDAHLGHIHYIHSTTDDKEGGADWSVDWIMKELMEEGLISPRQDRHIRKRMGFPPAGGE